MGNVTTYTYNQFSEQTTVTDPLGNTVTNTYNVHGDFASTTGGPGGTVSYTYSPSGNLTSMTNAAGTTTYQYDGEREPYPASKSAGPRDELHLRRRRQPAGRRTTTVTTAAGPTVLVTQVQYDAEGQVIKIIDALGGSTRRSMTQPVTRWPRSTPWGTNASTCTTIATN